MMPMSRRSRRRARGRAFVAASLGLACAAVLAHIKNEASQFPDIEFSDARFDIVLLVGAGIVPETPVFEPDKPLAKRELATWVALARGLGEGGETPDTDALAIAARDAGAVGTLEGNATYADLNRLFLNGAAAIENPQATPSKAEAASFIASRLDTAAGRTLLEQRGLSAGATGPVEAVTTGGDDHDGAYVVTVAGTAMPVDAHGRVANGPTDLLQWEGRRVRRSFVRGAAEDAAWIYLEAEPLEEMPAAATGPAAGSGPAEPPPPPDRRVLYWLIAGVVVLGVLLFFRRRRSG